MVEGKREIDNIDAELLRKDGNIDDLNQEIVRLKEEKVKNDQEIAELKESDRIRKIHIEMLFTQIGMIPADDKSTSGRRQ